MENARGESWKNEVLVVGMSIGGYPPHFTGIRTDGFCEVRTGIKTGLEGF